MGRHIYEEQSPIVASGFVEATLGSKGPTIWGGQHLQNGPACYKTVVELCDTNTKLLAIQIQCVPVRSARCSTGSHSRHCHVGNCPTNPDTRFD